MTKQEISINTKGQLSFAKLNHELRPQAAHLPENIIPRWELITSVAAWQSILPRIMECSAIGLDIETSGLDPHTAEIRLVQIAVSPEHVYILDMSVLKDFNILEPVLAAKKPVKIIHNASFELRFLAEKHNLEFGRIFDTMLASQLCYAGLAGHRHNLQAVVLRELGYQLDKRLQQSPWMSKTLSQAQFKYAALDASLLLPLRSKLIAHLKEADLINVAKLEFDCVRALAAMMYHGLYIDQSKLDSYINYYTQKAQELEQELQHNWTNINLNSPQQVLKFLHRQGINVSSTKDSSLRRYASEYPLIKTFLTYKAVAKRLNSTLQPLQTAINSRTGRIHPNFRQIGAVGGRMSCSNPNMQNVPRGKIRKIFAAPPRCKLIIADYSQIELRIIAEMSKDYQMIQAYQRGEDLHKRTAALLAGKAVQDVSKEERQKAKAVNFGLVYGMGAKGLTAYAQNSFGVKMELAEALQIRSAFFKTYKGLATWHRQLRQVGSSKSYNQTLSGRKRFYNSDERYATELYNLPVQGTGADIIKTALIKLHALLKDSPAHIVNCVHDEIVVECPENLAPEVAISIEKEMIAAGEQYLKLIPTVVDVKIADSWAEK